MGATTAPRAKADPLAFAATVRRALAMLDEDERRACLGLLAGALVEAADRAEQPAVRRALCLLVGDIARRAG